MIKVYMNSWGGEKTIVIDGQNETEIRTPEGKEGWIKIFMDVADLLKQEGITVRIDSFSVFNTSTKVYWNDNKCPKCRNEDHSEDAKYCKICGLKIERSEVNNGKTND